MSILCRKKGKKLKKRESEKALSVANSKVWEARLVVTERSRQEYRYLLLLECVTCGMPICLLITIVIVRHTWCIC